MFSPWEKFFFYLEKCFHRGTNVLCPQKMYFLLGKKKDFYMEKMFSSGEYLVNFNVFKLVIDFAN